MTEIEETNSTAFRPGQVWAYQTRPGAIKGKLAYLAPEYLRSDVDAVIVKAGSSDALSHAIVRMRDRELRKKIGEAGRATAQREFSLEKMVSRYENLLTAK